MSGCFLTGYLLYIQKHPNSGKKTNSSKLIFVMGNFVLFLAICSVTFKNIKTRIEKINHPVWGRLDVHAAKPLEGKNGMVTDTD